MLRGETRRLNGSLFLLVESIRLYEELNAMTLSAWIYETGFITIPNRNFSLWQCICPGGKKAQLRLFPGR